jgi:hypothetical protein
VQQAPHCPNLHPLLSCLIPVPNPPVLSSITNTMRLVPFLPHGHALALDAIMSPMAATPSIPFSCEATAQRGVRTFFPYLSLAPSTYLPFPSLYFLTRRSSRGFPSSLFLFFSPSSFNNYPLPCTTPSTLLAGFSLRRPLPLPHPLPPDTPTCSSSLHGSLLP